MFLLCFIIGVVQNGTSPNAKEEAPNGDSPAAADKPFRLDSNRANVQRTNHTKQYFFVTNYVQLHVKLQFLYVFDFFIIFVCRYGREEA